MPIRLENKARYPADWPQISQRIRERANWRCEECGVRNGELGGRAPSGNWHRASPLGCNGQLPAVGQYAWCDGYSLSQLRIIRIVLTVAHLDHTPENCEPGNLRAWCQRCHNRYDIAERRRGIKERARAALGVPDMLEQPHA